MRRLFLVVVPIVQEVRYGKLCAERVRTYMRDAMRRSLLVVVPMAQEFRRELRACARRDQNIGQIHSIKHSLSR